MSNDNQAFEVREKLAQLEAGLLETTPNIATLLRDIHRNLKADPDIVTILSEEDCSILVRGLKHQTSTSIATTALKRKPKKAISKMTVSDL
jgi:hypothetical protein